jgi:hypothetical protein
MFKIAGVVIIPMGVYYYLHKDLVGYFIRMKNLD